jgi:DnaJ-class molecular chaperone
VSNMTCATCGKENEWKLCKTCKGAGSMYTCPACYGEGGKWVCDCDKARAAVAAGLELKGE